MRESRELAEQPIQFEHVYDESEYGEKRVLEPSQSATAGGEEGSPAPSLETHDAKITAECVISSIVLPNTTSGIVSSTITDHFSSIELTRVSADAPIPRGSTDATSSIEPSQTHITENAEPSAILGRKETAEGRYLQTTPTTVTTTSRPSLEPTSPKGDYIITSWLKSKFSRRSSKPAKPDNHDLQVAGANSQFSDAAHTDAVAETKHSSSNHSSSYHHGDENLPVRKVAMTGNDAAISTNNKSTKFGTGVVSDLAKTHHSLSVGDEDVRGRPELIRAATGSSVGDDFEEARDHFDSEHLAPSTFYQVAGRGPSSPVRDSRFHENL